MKIQSFVFNPFYENTYIISDDEGISFVVDPGCYEEHEREEISDYIETNKLHIVGVYNTHCHIDHVLGNYFIKSKYSVPVHIPVDEQEVLRSVAVYAPSWGITGFDDHQADKLIPNEGIIEIGQLSFEIIHSPGHSPGHLAYYHRDSNVVIAGDIIFRDSIGRTDLPGGNHEQLLQNIRTKIFTLPDETKIYSGHGPSTTVAYERANNPFFL